MGRGGESGGHTGTPHALEAMERQQWLTGTLASPFSSPPPSLNGESLTFELACGLGWTRLASTAESLTVPCAHGCMLSGVECSHVDDACKMR